MTKSLIRSACLLGLLLLAAVVVNSCGTPAASRTGSNRLHLVAVLYSKYVSAHEGEMPANQEELVEYIDTNEREVLQRRGFRSAQDIFVETPGQPRIIVLYRDQRDRLQTEFVAIEEQDVKRGAGQVASDAAAGAVWFAADSLGVSRELERDEAARVLAETNHDANKLSKKTETNESKQE